MQPLLFEIVQFHCTSFGKPATAKNDNKQITHNDMNTAQNDRAANLPQGNTIDDPIIIDGQRLPPRWDDVFECPPRYYYDDETDTLCLDGYWGDIRLTDAPDVVIDGTSEVSMFSPAVKHLYLGPHFFTDDIRHVYPICLCPVYVSPMNRVYAEVNNIPVYKKDNKPVLPSLGEGLYKINRDGKWGVIDDNLNQVIPCKYDAIHIAPQGIYTVKKDGEEYTVDKFGNRIDNKS
jgi:hypothetical protein